MKLTYIVSLLFLSTHADGQNEEEDICADEPFQCNNQTIEVDDYLNFTWSTDLQFTGDMYNLVETPELDYQVPVLNGHFELNGWPDAYEITQDSSFRFCMQFWKKPEEGSEEQTDIFGSQQSKRNRLRFFNKKMSDFAFYPQLVLPKDGGEDGGNNPDYHNLMEGTLNTDGSERAATMRDDDTRLCHRAFQDGEDSQYLVPYAEGDPYGDAMGIAVLTQIINLSEKKAHVSFMRPLVATSEYDADFEEDQTYQVYINWGIFENDIDTQTTKVMGHKKDENNELTHAQDMKIVIAKSATSLMTSMIVLICLAVIEL